MAPEQPDIRQRRKAPPETDPGRSPLLEPAIEPARSATQAEDRSQIMEWLQSAFEGMRAELRVLADTVSRQQQALASRAEADDARERLVALVDELPDRIGMAVSDAMRSLAQPNGHGPADPEPEPVAAAPPDPEPEPVAAAPLDPEPEPVAAGPGDPEPMSRTEKMERLTQSDVEDLIRRLRAPRSPEEGWEARPKGLGRDQPDPPVSY